VTNTSRNNALDETLTAANAGQSSVKVRYPNSDGFADRMKMLIDRAGSAAEIARTCGFSEAVVRSWRDGNSDPSRDRCVALAAGTGASLLWLVAGEGPMLAADVAPTDVSPELRQEALKMSLQLAAEALGDRTLPPEKHAELVSLIYEGLTEGLPEAQILRFARLAAP